MKAEDGEGVEDTEAVKEVGGVKIIRVPSAPKPSLFFAAKKKFADEAEDKNDEGKGEDVVVSFLDFINTQEVMKACIWPSESSKRCLLADEI